MKKDSLQTSSPRGSRLATRQPSFFSPSFDDLWEPSRVLSQLFDREMMMPFGSDSRFVTPAIDIDETDSEYIVTTDLPGIKKEDISIECSGNQLTISAERKYESDDGRKQGRRERFYGTYQRSFTLPSGVEVDNVEASYDGGVLTVHVPKGEKEKARRIEVKGGERAASKIQGKH